MIHLSNVRVKQSTPPIENTFITCFGGKVKRAVPLVVRLVNVNAGQLKEYIEELRKRSRTDIRDGRLEKAQEDVIIIRSFFVATN